MKKLTLRPYQREAIEAVNQHLRTKKSNPCIVLPTGAGKSLVMAEMLVSWLRDYPPFRACVLAHRQELVEQNAEEMRAIDPWLSIGIYAAGLRKRETQQSVTFASIDSAHDKADIFAPFDVLLIDEAHRIPIRGEGKYRRFIDDCIRRNPRLRVVGLTATPFRMGVGNVCHEDHILNEIVYTANVGDLIEQGYLSKIKTLRGDVDIDLSGVKRSGNDFNKKQLDSRINTGDVVGQAIADMVQNVRAEKRKSVIVFCISVAHCERVKNELSQYGIDAKVVTGETPKNERRDIINEFRDGKIQYLLSVDVFFEGFNVRRVDCIGFLRPTQSRGIWIQGIGRGLRLFDDKDYCLVLDYGQNIDRHGPIDIDEMDSVKVVTCKDCQNVFSRAVRVCPSCGWDVPPMKVPEGAGSGARQRTSMHTANASTGLILNEPYWMSIDQVFLSRHVKRGKPDSVRVTYAAGIKFIDDWKCPDHDGWAGINGQKWVRDYRLIGENVDEIIENRAKNEEILRNAIGEIKVVYRGKFLSVIDQKPKESLVEK